VLTSDPEVWGRDGRWHIGERIDGAVAASHMLHDGRRIRRVRMRIALGKRGAFRGECRCSCRQRKEYRSGCLGDELHYRLRSIGKMNFLLEPVSRVCSSRSIHVAVTGSGVSITSARSCREGGKGQYKGLRSELGFRHQLRRQQVGPVEARAVATKKIAALPKEQYEEGGDKDRPAGRVRL
jgi:hypothetical protein